MAWKDLSYTKKGALIAGTISLIGILIAIINMSIGHPLGIITIFAIPFALIGTYFGLIGLFGCGFESSICPIEQTFGFIITLILYSLIGALIGFIFGKIKSKKSANY